MESFLITEQYIKHCINKGLSRHSIRAYEHDLADYHQRCANQTPYTPYTKESLVQWLEHMRLQQLSPASIKRRIACIKTFFFWMEEQGYIHDNPFHKRNFLSITQPKRLPRHLSCEVISRLIKHVESKKTTEAHKLIHHTLHLALLLLYSTGMRVSELCSIKLDDIDDNFEKINIQGKGNRERHVFIINHHIKALLLGYLKQRGQYSPASPHLFINKHGGLVTPNYLREHIHQNTQEMGLQRRITPHMLRHSAAAHLLDAGVDIRHVQKLLGHSSISVTEIYTHVSTTQLQTILQKTNITNAL